MDSLAKIGVIAVIILVVVLALILAALAVCVGVPDIVKGGAEAPRTHIVVPYRAGPDQPERKSQFARFVDHFAGWARAGGRDIHIVEQAPGLPFNRGALLNAGFDLIRKGGGSLDDIYVFHDIDLLPDPALLRQYEDPPPVHFASVWDRYTSHIMDEDKKQRYLGGVLSLTGRHFVKTGGFPNDFWGWGGEDDLLRDRIQEAGLWKKVTRPTTRTNPNPPASPHRPTHPHPARRPPSWAPHGPLTGGAPKPLKTLKKT